MEDRRKNKRTNMPSTIIIERLDDNSSHKVSIDIVDVSKTGIGFLCDEVLQIGEVYESYLTIWTKEVIHAFLRIVRIELNTGSFSYGAVFIGMPEMDSSRIETYQTVQDCNKDR